MTYEMEGEGIPLVFIHEVATDHRLWTYQRSYFQSSYRVITVDVLGHGQAAWPEHELSIEHAAQRVQQLIERLGVGPVFAIGVSMGALIALQVALNAPTLIQGLVLVSPWSHANGHMQSLIDRLYRLAEAGDMTTYTTTFLRYMFPAADLASPLPEVEWLRMLALGQPAQVVAYAWAACLAADLSARLGEMSVPTLIIAGLNDFFTPPYLAREVAAGLSSVESVEVEVWEETGHFPLLEDPVRFNRRLEAFLLRCLTQGSAP
jgi:pimeloyl-ACP methyl ester carboxylesterase